MANRVPCTGGCGRIIINGAAAPVYRKGYEYDISTPTGTGTMREPLGGCVYTSLKAAREAAAQSALYNLTH